MDYQGVMKTFDQRDSLMTPKEQSKIASKRGSINFKEMRDKYNNAREQLQTQGNARFKHHRNNSVNTNFQGGFQAGFLATQNSQTWAKNQSLEFGVSAKPVVFSVRGPVINRNKTSCATSKKRENDLSLNEMVEGGNKIAFALTQPKFGVKGYNIQQTSQFEPQYKIRNIAVTKRKTRENYIDDVCKANAWKKPAQYEMITDWTKNFK